MTHRTMAKSPSNEADLLLLLMLSDTPAKQEPRVIFDYTTKKVDFRVYFDGEYTFASLHAVSGPFGFGYNEKTQPFKAHTWLGKISPELNIHTHLFSALEALKGKEYFFREEVIFLKDAWNNQLPF